MMTRGVLHCEVMEKLGEARLLTISSGLRGQGGFIRRSLSEGGTLRNRKKRYS
jgi:hypothetical protein